MKYLAVKDYWRYQSHQDGRRPAWIKMYLALLDDRKFHQLPESARYHLLMIWLIAADTSNKMPVDPDEITWRIRSETRVDIELLMSSGFLEVVECEELVESRRTSCDSVATRTKSTKPYKKLRKSTKSHESLPREEKRREEEIREEVDHHPTDDPRLRRDELANRVIELWNETASVNDLPIVRTPISAQRRTHLRKRLDVASWFDDYVAALAEIPQSSFLTGGSGWRADIDFMLRPETVTKILEGKYRDKAPRAPVAPPAPAGPYANRPRPSWINEQGDNWLMSDDAERDSAAFFAEHGTIAFSHWCAINGHPYP